MEIHQYILDFPCNLGSVPNPTLMQSSISIDQRKVFRGEKSHERKGKFPQQVYVNHLLGCEFPNVLFLGCKLILEKTSW